MPTYPEIEKTIEDIRYIRQSLEHNGQFFRQVMYTRPYRIVFWLSGIFMLVLGFLFHRQTVAAAGTLNWRILLISASVLMFVMISALKIGGLLSLKKFHPGKNLVQLSLALIGKNMILVYLISALLMAFFSVYFCLTGLPWVVFPVLAVGCGFMFAQIGSFFSMTEVLVCGVLMIIPGAVSVPFLAAGPSYVWLWTGVTFGTALIAAGVIMELKLMKTGQKKG